MGFPGPSDDSLRRAGLIRYANDDDAVPEACKSKSYYDAEKKTHVIPMLSQDCYSAILQKDKSHIVTVGDVTKLIEWWAKNSKDTGTAAWMITGGPIRATVGKPIASLPASGGTNLDHVASVEEQAKNVLGFLGNAETWISFGMLALGLVLVAYGGTRWLRGS